MAKDNKININSGGGPVFTEKVDNRGGVIRGRSDHYNNGLRIYIMPAMKGKFFKPK